ncbi:MAG: hypothetical protein ACE5GJ_05735 [Gemmatimonadota bacterium]
MVRKSLIAAALILIAAPLAAQEDIVWTSKRPDGHAPLGVVADRTLEAGEYQFTYRYSQIKSRGVWFDNDSLTLEETFDFYPQAPLSLDNISHIFGVAWGMSDDFTLNARWSYSQRERRQLTQDGVFYVVNADGIGDAEVSGLYRFYDEGAYRAHVEAGFLLPTGDVDVQAETPFSTPDKEPLPYDMRPGAGTFAFIPGLTASAQNEAGSVGAQIRGWLFWGTNDVGYTPGDRLNMTTWGAYRVNDFFSVSARMEYQKWQGLDGADADLDPLFDPGNDAFFLKGSTLTIPVGVNFYLPEGTRFAGNRLAVEAIYPVYQSYEGPQLGLDWGLLIGWQVAF